MKTILFATGIECSQPMVQGGIRRDQLEETGHYRHWKDDLRLSLELGAVYLRYGIPYYRMHKTPDSFDWEWTDLVMPAMRDMGVIPIVDLCHYGVPDWAGDFQNTDWPELFGRFAGAFAARYPWVKYYTPVNEIRVCASLSAELGLWNERQTSDRAYVRSLINQCRASQLAMEAILQHVSEAVFIQSEAAEVTLQRYPGTRRKVEFENQWRFVTYDFMYGHDTKGDVLMYLMDNGVTRETHEWLMEHGRRTAPRCIMGMDYYAHNEKIMRPDGHTETLPGQTLGWHTIAADYFERYHRPMMLTETNTIGAVADTRVNWLWKMWFNVQKLRNTGVPVIGFTWYSLQDQVDWDTLLQEQNGTVTPVGLVDINRNIRDVGYAFRDLVRTFSHYPLLEDFPIGEICEVP